MGRDQSAMVKVQLDPSFPIQINSKIDKFNDKVGDWLPWAAKSSIAQADMVPRGTLIFPRLKITL